MQEKEVGCGPTCHHIPRRKCVSEAEARDNPGQYREADLVSATSSTLVTLSPALTFGLSLGPLSYQPHQFMNLVQATLQVFVFVF